MTDKAEAVTVSGEGWTGKQELEALMPRLRAIPAEKVRGPRKKVDIIVQAAFDVYHTACRDRAELEGLGLSWDVVEDLLKGASALGTAQVQWEQTKSDRRIAAQEWKKLFPRACAVRKRLLEVYTFAYRQDEDVLRQLRAHRGRPTHARIILDLGCLASESRAMQGSIGLPLRGAAGPWASAHTRNTLVFSAARSKAAGRVQFMLA